MIINWWVDLIVTFIIVAAMGSAIYMLIHLEQKCNRACELLAEMVDSDQLNTQSEEEVIHFLEVWGSLNSKK